MCDIELDPRFKWKDCSISEAIQILQTNPSSGLTNEEVQRRVEKFGLNKLEETVVNPWLLFFSFMWNPLSWAMEVAAVIAIFLVDYADFLLIFALLILNACIGYFEEMSAGNAVAALMGQLAPQSKAKREGQWVNIPACELVPGDIVRIRLGDVVPADLKLLEGDEIKIDQSSLTGESLPVTKYAGSEAYSGSIVKQGEIECVVYATGVNTFFGKAANLIEETDSTGRLQQVLTKVGNFCIVSIILWVVIELIIQFGVRHNPCVLGEDECATLSNVLVLIVGGIPVAMPTVLSVTMAIGATKLAKRDAIVTRLTCIEEMASMEILCSDKTGTLTLNQLSVDHESLFPLHDFNKEDILFNGALAARLENNEPIDVCVHNSCAEKDTLWNDYTLLHYVPFDPVNKKTVAKVKENSTGKIIRTTKGAPQVILNLDKQKGEIEEKVNKMINELANRGYRALGVARAENGESILEDLEWKMVGLIPLFDPPRHDSGDTIRRAKALGVDVKMITGDQLAIAIETCRQLGIPRDILTTEFFDKDDRTHGRDIINEQVEKADGFAEVFPEHKYEIVKRLQEREHIVGMTGDGVNDAPALKVADIGIAVDDATDAARAAADIVLVSPGLSVIIDAIIGSRKIFQRMKNYAIYSIAMTVRIVFTFGLLTCIYDWYFPTIIIVILAVLNDGTVMSISKDRVTPSEDPDSWKLKEVFITAIALGLWLTISTVILFDVGYQTQFFTETFGLDDFSVQTRTTLVTPHECSNFENFKFNKDAFSKMNGDDQNFEGCAVPAVPVPAMEQYYSPQVTVPVDNQLQDFSLPCLCGIIQSRDAKIRGLIYIQVSVTGQGTIFVTRAHSFFFLDRPAIIVILAFIFAQVAATLIGVYGFGGYPVSRQSFEGCGWGYALVAWVWSIIWFIPLDFIKFFVRFCLSNRLSATYNRTTFTTRINAGHATGRSTNVSQKMSTRRASQRILAKKMSVV